MALLTGDYASEGRGVTVASTNIKGWHTGPPEAEPGGPIAHVRQSHEGRDLVCLDVGGYSGGIWGMSEQGSRSSSDPQTRGTWSPDAHARRATLASSLSEPMSQAAISQLVLTHDLSGTNYSVNPYPHINVSLFQRNGAVGGGHIPRSALSDHDCPLRSF